MAKKNIFLSKLYNKIGDLIERYHDGKLWDWKFKLFNKVNKLIVFPYWWNGIVILDFYQYHYNKIFYIFDHFSIHSCSVLYLFTKMYYYFLFFFMQSKTLIQLSLEDIIRHIRVLGVFSVLIYLITTFASQAFV